MADFEDFFGETAPAAEPEDENVMVGQYVPTEAPPLEVVPRPLPPLQRPAELARPSDAIVAQDFIREAEERLARRSTDILEAALDWPVVAQLKEPPEAWVESMGKEKAWERFTVAQSALMSKARAPVGLEIAAKLMMGVSKNRAGNGDMDRPLNLAIVEIHMGDVPKFPEVVETEGE